MKKENENRIRKRAFGRHRTLRYGMLTLAVLMAAVIAVQMVPGGTEDSSADDIVINLNNNTGSGAGYLWSGDTLTITGYDNNYTITQNNTGLLERNIIIKDSGSSSTVTVIIKNINIKGIITLEGNASVNLLLDGINKISGSIFVADTYYTKASLKIDSPTNGSLDVMAGSGAAGIGGVSDGSDGSGGTITINGGTVKATGGNGAAGIGGGSDGSNDTITINGGTVTAIGGINGAGIGSGFFGGGGTITINGGIVTATGGINGAGIGGGETGPGGTITINGGTVTATGGSSGAGIGGGEAGGGGTITINGGTVTATGGGNGAGIGGGDGGDGGTITINGGTVTATGGGNGAGIGGGDGKDGDKGNGGTITISGGTVTATGGSGSADIGGAGIGGGYNSASGAVLTIKNEASIKAFSKGDLPAIHADSVTISAGTGFFVNAVLGSNLPSASTTLLIYADGDMTTELVTLTPPAATYKSFAFMLPGSSSSKNYNIFAQYEGGSKPMLKSSDDSPVIASVNTVEYTDVKLGDILYAVTNISDVPNEAVVGTPLTLSGTVTPTNASFKAITWSVESAGTTGAAIEDGVLTATDAGTVTVTATIANGTSPGTDYKKDFTITVSAEGAGETEGSGGGSNTLLWIGIAAVIIVLLLVTVFLLQKKGIIKGI